MVHAFLLRGGGESFKPIVEHSISFQKTRYRARKILMSINTSNDVVEMCAAGTESLSLLSLNNCGVCFAIVETTIRKYRISLKQRSYRVRVYAKLLYMFEIIHNFESHAPTEVKPIPHLMNVNFQFFG